MWLLRPVALVNSAIAASQGNFVRSLLEVSPPINLVQRERSHSQLEAINSMVTMKLALVVAAALLSVLVADAYEDAEAAGRSEERNLRGSSKRRLSRMDWTLLKYLDESSHGRDAVIDLLVNEYTSKNNPDKDMIDWLESAIEAVELSEADGEPVQIEGHEFLFVGSVGEFFHLYKGSLLLQCSDQLTEAISSQLHPGIKKH